MDKEFIEDLARKYANACEFRSDHKYDRESVFKGYIEGFATCLEDVLHFSEWMNLVCIRDNRHKWTYKGDNHSKKHSTSEMLEIWKTEVNKLKH